MDEGAGVLLLLIGIALKIVGPVVCASKAEELNRSGVGWGFFGFFMPILAMIIVDCLKPVVDWHEEK